jgi:ribonuclease P protein component
MLGIGGGHAARGGGPRGCGASLQVTIVPTFTLGPERRLRRAAEFRQLYASGRRLGSELFTAVVRPNQLATARLGMSVAARSVRRAVDRNRVRRVIRESFRARALALPSVDIVVGARSAAQAASNARLRESLDRLWQKIANTCER